MVAACPGRLVNAPDGCMGPLWALATPPAACSSVSPSASVTMGRLLEGAAKGIRPSPPSWGVRETGSSAAPTS